MDSPVPRQFPIEVAKVRIGDIVPHEKPNPRRVSTLIRLIRAGVELPPITIGSDMYQHWQQGPREMEPTGFGYMLVDGHHRLAALKKVYGIEQLIEVKMWNPA